MTMNRETPTARAPKTKTCRITALSSMSMAEATRVLTGPGGPFEIGQATVGGRPTRIWQTVPQTTRELVESMVRWGDREYLVYESDRLTYADAFVRIATLAARMRAQLGIAKGDRVAIAMRNYPEWALCLWASTSLGAIAVPLNAWWQGEELAYGLTDSGARLLFADEERIERLLPHRAALGVQVVAVRAASSHPGDLGFDELLAGPPERELPPAEVAPEDDATIFYTSGTTGRPKGALGTHRNLCTNVGSSAFARARRALQEGEAPPGEDQQAITLVSVPFFHVTGCHSRLAIGTFQGGKIITMRRWDPTEALRLIDQERVTGIGGVPAVVWQLLESPDLQHYDTSSIKVVAYGGAPAAPELVRRLKETFPHAVPSNGYGLTETSAVTAINVGEDYRRKPDSVGAPVPVCDVKIIDEQGQTLPVGAVGQLCIRGPNVIRGYWQRPEATAEVFRDGWLHSGDVARLDDEGFIYVLDRKKDMLIRGGENVYCVEVESALHSHPDVLDVAVIGIAHRVLGEEVGAVVQGRPGANLTMETLQAHARQRLAHFKVPARVAFRDAALPRNANGKILKRTLREELGWDQLS